MLAIEIVDKALKPAERPVPKILGQQVLIQVHAAGINRPDVMQRKGLYPPPSGASDIPGLEVAGEIVAVADQVSSFSVGDRVCALVTGGGYAEYCLAEAALCLPIPKGLSAIQAAAIPETFFTVWSNVFDRAQLKEDEWVLLHGGSSGIGTTAIQLIKAFNGCVIVTAGTEEKCVFCRQLGADEAINYRQMDFVEAVQQFTSGRGVDVVLDMVGGNYFSRNLKCMNEEARLVQIAVQAGVRSEINLLDLMLKRITLTGSTLRARDVHFKQDIANKLIDQVWPLLIDGRVAPVIYETVALSAAAEAHEIMELGQHIGKIVLTVA